MRTISAGILAVAIALSAAACSSAAPARSVGSAKPRTSATPAPLAGLTPDQIVQKALKNLAAAS